MSIPPSDNPPPDSPLPNNPPPGAPSSWPPPPGGYAPPQYQPQPQAIGGFGGMIPTGNPPALWAYYLGLLSLLPCLAIPIGITAFVMGLKGLKMVKERPEVRGRTHALVGVILGGLCALLNIVGLIVALAGTFLPHASTN